MVRHRAQHSCGNQGKAQVELPEPCLIRRETYCWVLKATTRFVRFLREAHQHGHDPSALPCRRVQKESIIQETLHRTRRAYGRFGGRTNDRDGTKVLVQKESWLRHDQIGLKKIG